jgi:hypothetical protein
MRKFLSILGALTLVVIVAVGAGVGVLAYKGHALDVESKAFVDGAVPAIAAAWSTEQLLDRATPELRERAKPQELRAFFDTLSRLGPLAQYDGATGEASMAYFTGSGSTVSAAYVANARFRNGSATFRIRLMKRDGRWMIHNFQVRPAPDNKTAQGT